MNVRGLDDLFIATLVVDKDFTHQFLEGDQQVMSVQEGLKADLPNSASYEML